MSDEKEGSGTSVLSSISGGAGLFLIGRAMMNVLSFALNIVLTRGLGASLYGVYSYINIVFALLEVFTTLGGDKAMLRYLPEFNDCPRLQNAMLLMAYLTSLVASIIVAGIIYFTAPLISEFTLNQPIFINVLRVAAIALLFQTLSKITSAAFKGIDRMDLNVGVSSIIRPTLRLIFVGGAVLLGFSLYKAMVGYVIAGILTFATALLFLNKWTKLGTFAKPTNNEVVDYYKFSIPLTFNHLGSFLYNRVDILMVGFFLTSSVVGIYNIAVVISGVLALPLMAFNQMFPPTASRLYHSGEIDELESVYSTVTRWIFTLSLFPAIGAIIYSREILSIFGTEFVEGQLILILFALAQLTNCAVGPSGYLLMMSDHHYLTMVNQLSSGVLNVVLNVLFILEFGFIGAALATASILAIINLIRVFEVWHLEGILPYNKKYTKPIVAGGMATILMILLKLLFNGFLLLLAGGFFGGILFFSVLYLLGIDDSERQMFELFVTHIS